MKDELTQIAALRTKYVIMGSDICRSMIKDYSKKTTPNSTLKTLADIIHLDQIPKVDDICIDDNDFLIGTFIYLLEFSCHRWW
jgi:hypothetical protein